MRFESRGSIVAAIVVVLLLGLAMDGFAQNGQVRQSDYLASGPGGTSATTTLTLATGNLVTEVILSASAAGSVVEIYDTAVTTTRAAAIAAVGGPKVLIKQATDENSSPPFVSMDNFTLGIFVYVSKGEVIIKRLRPI